MARIAPPIAFSKTDRVELDGLARRGTTSQYLAVRARVILKATDGLRNDQIAEVLGISRHTVSKWRKRWLGGGMVALKDAPPSDRSRCISSDQESRLISVTRTQLTQ